MPWNLYTKYMLAFLLILCLPIITLGSFLYVGAANSLRQEVEEAGQTRLKQAMDMIDQNYLGLVSTTMLLSMDPMLTPFQLQSGTFAQLEAIKELTRYKVANTYLEDLLFHIFGDSLIFSPEGTLDQRTFSSKYFLSGEEGTDSYLRQMLNARAPYVRPSDIRQPKPSVTPEKEILSVGMPFPMNTLNPRGIVVYLLDRDKFINSIMPVLGEFKGVILLFDRNNKLLTSNYQGLQLDPDLIPQLLELSVQPDNHKGLVQHKNYSVSWIHSTITGWTCMTIFPKDQFYSRVLKMTSFITYMLVIVALIGVLIAGYFAYRFYKPVQQIVHRIQEDRKRSSDVSPPHHEYDFIAHSINAMTLSHQEMMEQMESQRQLIHDQFLVMLLRGDFEEEEDILVFRDKHQLTLRGQSFVAVSLSLKQTDHSEVRNAITAMSAIQMDSISIYPIEMFPSGKLMCIVGLDIGMQEPEQLTVHAAKFIRNLFYQKTGEYPTISIGNTYVSYKGIHRSYIEVMATDECKIKFPAGSLIHFRDIVSWEDGELSTAWYDLANKVTLIQSIKQGDKELSKESLALIISEILNQRSLLMTKCMVSDLINAIYRVLNELAFPGSAEEIHQLLSLNDIHKLGKELSILVSRLCEHVNQSRTTETNELKRKVLTYIQENFSYYEFNLEQAAEHFEVSTSYLSRFIKEHTGSTFTDYVLELRIEYVKNELLRTEKSVKDIITGAGYVNVSYFIDRFKKKEGMTPGEFRKSRY